MHFRAASSPLPAKRSASLRPAGGFAFGQHAPLYLGMILAVVAGTALGTRILAFIPEQRFAAIFKAALTLLALRLIASGLPLAFD